ncbi:MAG: ABC transporter substrate-binding protein, partial [Erysipelotrichaceae bacterium]|nr:ABC transporter substrate-binding protein [Erysipelotrichaceae bacterium]
MRFRRILVVLLVVFLLAGCSQQANNESSKPVLRVGMECNYAPFNWTTTAKGATTVAISAVDYADGFDVVIAS